MFKYRFVLFLVVIGVLVAALLGAIQTPWFADAINKGISAYLPKKLGIEGSFTELRIKFFPPGVEIKGPRLAFKEANAIGLPKDTVLSAEGVELSFIPAQAFSRDLRVERFKVTQGLLRSKFDSSILKGKGDGDTHFELSDLTDVLKIKVEEVILEDSKVQLESDDQKVAISFDVTDLSLKKMKFDNSPGLDAKGNLSHIQIVDSGGYKALRVVPKRIDEFQFSAEFSAERIQVRKLKVRYEDFAAQFRGGVTDTDFVGDYEIAGQVGDLAALLPNHLNARGKIEAKGKINSKLDHFVDSLQIDSFVHFTDLYFDDWVAEKVDLDGSFKAGIVQIDKLELFSPPVERIAPSLPASGGKVTVKPFKFSTSFKSQFELEMALESVHLQWVLRPFVDQIFNLDFRTTGTVGVSFVPGNVDRGWNATVNSDLRVPRLILDNQAMNRSRKRQKILDVEGIKLKGIGALNSNEYRIKEMELSIDKSKMMAKGSVNFKKGLNIDVQGFSDLAEVGEIAEIKFEGTGNINTLISGPFDAIKLDFDFDLLDAKYVSLSFGKVNGQIRYDDSAGKIYFQSIRAIRNQTSYVGAGLLDLDKDNEINLEVKILRGDMSDMNQIFSKLTENIWWYPHTLSGPVSGTVTVSNKTDLEKLNVVAEITGKDWQYLREKFKSVSAILAYRGGTYSLKNLRAIKHNGTVSGQITYDNHSKLNWNFTAKNLKVDDIDLFQRMNVPAKGNLYIKSEGEGKLDSLESDSRLAVQNFIVRGKKVPPSSFNLKTSRGIVWTEGRLQGDQALVKLMYDQKNKETSRLALRGRKFDFSHFLLLLNSKLLKDPKLKALISGDFDLRFKAGKVELGSGNFAVSEFQLANSKSLFELVEPIIVPINHGNYKVENLSVKGGGSEATLAISGQAGHIEGNISGDVNMAIFEYATDVIEQAKGRLTIDLGVDGYLKAPEVIGSADLINGNLKVSGLDSHFENVSGKFLIRQNVVKISELVAQLGEGRASATGEVELFPNRFPKIDIRSKLDQTKLRIFPFQFVKVTGGLRTYGERLPYVVEGDLLTSEGVSNESFFGGNSVRQRAAKYLPQNFVEKTDLPFFALNIGVHAKRGIRWQNEVMDAEWKFDLRVVNTLEAPRLSGSAEVLDGKLLFKERTFKIQACQAKFDNPLVLDPRVTLNASTSVNDTEIQLFFRRVDGKNKAELTSDPAMPQSEIISLLALGYTSKDVQKLGNNAALKEGDAASLLFYSLDFNRDIKKKTGFELEFQDAVDQSAGKDLVRGGTSIGKAPKIVAKKKLGEKFNFSLGTTIGVGDTSQYELNAEYEVAPAVSILGILDNSQGDEVKSTSENSTSLGIDIKVQKRFK